MGNIFQFWKTQMVLGIFLILLPFIFLIFTQSYIQTLPRSGVPFFATVFSTLLGLTFTAFSIIGAFMPNIEVDFLQTKTFEVFISTFKVTMLTELFSLIISIMTYLASGQYFTIFFDLLIVFTSLTLGFMGFLLLKTFKVFAISKKSIIKN